MTELENKIQSDILKYIRKTFKGCVLIKFEDAKTHSILDTYFAYKGISVWFEVKRPNAPKSNSFPLQKYMAKKLLKNSIPAYFVESVADVRKILIDKLAILP